MPNENSYEVALKKSDAIRADLDVNPQNYTMLTGDRPTGRLHVGHCVGSLRNRVILQNSGKFEKLFFMIADAQAQLDAYLESKGA